MCPAEMCERLSLSDIISSVIQIYVIINYFLLIKDRAKVIISRFRRHDVWALPSISLRCELFKFGIICIFYFKVYLIKRITFSF